MSKSKNRKRPIHVNGELHHYKAGKRQVRVYRPDETSYVIDKKLVGIGEYEVVTPNTVQNYLTNGVLKNPEEYFHHCKHENRTVQAEPYLCEVEGKIEYVFYCENCYNLRAHDI